MLNNGSNINVRLSSNRVIAKSSEKSPQITFRISPDLQTFLSEADESKFIFKVPSKEKNLFIVLAREPSRKNRSAGYCGAGYEDYLLLVEAQKNRLLISDKFLIQSCYKSLLLDSDNGDDPINALSLDAEKSTITYRLVGDDEETKRIIHVTPSRFEVQ